MNLVETRVERGNTWQRIFHITHFKYEGIDLIWVKEIENLKIVKEMGSVERNYVYEIYGVNRNMSKTNIGNKTSDNFGNYDVGRGRFGN